jgi:O-antigen/teichoic acid export membrane protein
VLFLAVPILVGLAFLGRQFLALWMGPQYAETCYPAMLILVMPMPIALAQTIGARILQGKGTVAPLFWLTLVQGALTVAIGVALVRPFGIEGVAWGSSIALTLQSLAVITLACRNVGAAISTYLLRAWMLPALAALVLVGVATISRSYISAISHWGTLCLTVLIGLTMYFPLVVLLDSSLRRLLRRLSSLLISWSSQRFEAT